MLCISWGNNEFLSAKVLLLHFFPLSLPPSQLFIPHLSSLLLFFLLPFIDAFTRDVKKGQRGEGERREAEAKNSLSEN